MPLGPATRQHEHARRKRGYSRLNSLTTPLEDNLRKARTRSALAYQSYFRCASSRRRTAGILHGVCTILSSYYSGFREGPAAARDPLACFVLIRITSHDHPGPCPSPARNIVRVAIYRGKTRDSSPVCEPRNSERCYTARPRTGNSRRTGNRGALIRELGGTVRCP